MHLMSCSSAMTFVSPRLRGKKRVYPVVSQAGYRQLFAFSFPQTSIWVQNAIEALVYAAEAYHYKYYFLKLMRLEDRGYINFKLTPVQDQDFYIKPNVL